VNLLIRRGVTHARVNWGRWIGDCVFCRSAMQLPPGCPVFTCHDCGESVEVEWPNSDLADGVQRLLMMRPEPYTRNWETGETLHDLLQENMLHGIMPAELDSPGVLLSISGDRIIADALPFSSRRQLEGGQ